MLKTGKTRQKNKAKNGPKKRAKGTKPWQNMAKPKVSLNFGLGLPNPVLEPLLLLFALYLTVKAWRRFKAVREKEDQVT